MKKFIKICYKCLRGIYRVLPLSTSTRIKIKGFVIRGLSKFQNSLGYNGTIVGSQYSFDAENLDIKDEIINIYTQYVDDILQTGKRCDEFVEYKENHIAFTDKDVKPIAFYLPQFYTFPENDEWWGKGFTEWTNVTKSMPRFLGHYQPHLPYDSTFYDLNNVEILKGQVSLAKNYGIYGFCFHYYWFSGKRLLEKPLNNFLKTKEGLDFPFCISWANENWSRRWDGSDQEILMAQKHSDEDDLACIADICQYVRDERYIRIKGKPLIIIYNASLLPDANKTIKIWRDYCKENGIGDICLAGAQTNPTKDPLVYDFDEAVEFPPHYYWLAASNITQKMTPITDKHGLSIYDMEEYIEQKRHYSIQPEKIYKSIFPNWDNTPRKGTNGIVFQMNPQLYKKWLLDIINYTKENRESGDRFIFINAWNEWAEGAHLEPDRKYGYANLQATADAICELRE